MGLERALSHAMYHYFFKALDIAATEAVLGDWVRGSGPVGHVALDGKRLRGSAPAGHDGSEGVHLVAAFASALRGVIGQLRVEPDGNEITAALTLLKGLPGRRGHGRRGLLPAGDLPGHSRRTRRLSVRGQKPAPAKAGANRPELMAGLVVAFGDASPPPELIKALRAKVPSAHDGGLPRHLMARWTAPLLSLG